MADNNKPRFDDNNGEGFDLKELHDKESHNQRDQPATSDDLSDNRRTEFDANHLGDGLSIGNEDLEADGGADLGFDETDETEDKDRDNPLRASSSGGGTSDGTNEGNRKGGKGNSGGNIGNLSGEYDTNSSSAGGSGTMRK
jgi:hypothetical protein